MNRRTFLAASLGIVPAALLGRVALPGSAAAQPLGLLTTTDLNLREGPGTSSRVLRVIPARAHVSDHGVVENGFRQVTYDNTRGWAFDAYLTAGEPVPPHAGPVIGIAYATFEFNLRAAPGAGDKVLRVVPVGSAVEVTETVVDGYRYVYVEGLGGWANDGSLSGGALGPEPYDPNYATTTADVNLRAEPSLSGAVLAVIPANTRVCLNPESAKGFRGVEYNGINGWVRVDYLN